MNEFLFHTNKKKVIRKQIIDDFYLKKKYFLLFFGIYIYIYVKLIKKKLNFNRIINNHPLVSLLQ